MGRTTFLDRYRIALAEYVDASICYTDDIAEELSQLSPRVNTFVARNTLDTDTLSREYERLSKRGKRVVRSDVGLDSDRTTLVYIGRLIESKGVDYLPEVLRLVNARTPSQMVIIGDGPRRNAIERATGDGLRQHLHMVGTIADLEKSAPYIYASDAMVVPGYLGLQVNHAFALGVPVVSRLSPGAFRFHSPEISYVKDGVNARLVPGGDAESLAEGLYDVLNRESYGENALAYARQHLRMEYMVDGLEDAVRFLESKGENVEV